MNPPLDPHGPDAYGGDDHGRHKHECEHSDDVVANFLDGASTEADPWLIAHLEGCPRCAQVLRAQRRIDALIASRTATDVEEAQADRLLAFLHESPAGGGTADGAADGTDDAAASKDAVVAPSLADAEQAAARRAPFVRLAAAGLLAAGLVLALTFGLGGREAPVSSPSASRTHVESTPSKIERVADADVEALPSRSKGFLLPKGFRGVPKKLTAAHLSRRVLRRAFEGYYVPEARDRALATRALGIFASAAVLPRASFVSNGAPHAASTPAVGPVRITHDSQLRVAAALWYGHRIVDRSRVCRDHASWLRFVLASAGAERLAIVRGLCHDAPELMSALPVARRAAFAGAVGFRFERAEMRRWRPRDFHDYIVEASKTGDAARVDAMLGVFLFASRRNVRLGEVCAHTIASLARANRQLITSCEGMRTRIRRGSDDRALAFVLHVFDRRARRRTSARTD